MVSLIRDVHSKNKEDLDIPLLCNFAKALSIQVD